MKKKKLLPVPVLILIDVLALGACLCVYALFHHVLNWGGAWEVAAHSNIPTTVVSAPAPTPSPTPQGEELDAPESTEVPEPINYGQFGEKFQDKFTTNGEIIQTDTLYVSENIRAELIDDRMFNSDIHIVDIYVRNIENLRCTFAGGDDLYDGTRATVPDMAERVNAVAAINGDYCGFVMGGEYVVLRNGLFFSSHPTRGVCVLYYDGTMKTYWKPFNQTGDDFDIDEALENGAWQIWSFGPALLDEEGHANPMYDPTVYQPRTMIGYYEPGHYCFVTVEGRSDNNSGMNLDKLAALAESMGLTEAFNLDGGGSSTLVFGGELVNYGSPYEGLRKVTDMIYIGEIGSAQPEEGDE